MKCHQSVITNERHKVSLENCEYHYAVQQLNIGIYVENSLLDFEI